MSDLPPHEEIRKIQVPVLILAWVDDAMHPLTIAKALDDLLPQSRLRIAMGMDDLRAWPRYIQDFIEGLSKG